MRARLISALISVTLMSPAAAAPTSSNIVTLSPEQSTCNYPCGRVAVIFVHGITGDATTWTATGQPSWPELLANDPLVGQKLDVYRLDYFSQLNDGASASKISEKIGEKLDALLFNAGYSKI